MSTKSDICGFIGNITNNLKTNEWGWAEKTLEKYLEQDRFCDTDKRFAWEKLNQKKSRIVFPTYSK